ncbi:MAG: HAD family phosphatase [bacterium]|nr:HAD family phosphatase [bacterium]
MAIRGVIFDLDGVLIDSAHAHLQSWKALARIHQRTIDEATFAATFGRPNVDIVPLMFPEETTPEGIRRIGEEKERVYRDLVRGRMPIIPGAADLVRMCDQDGLRLAIGSSAPPENIALALAELGVSDRITAIVSGDDVRRGKPDPEVFVLAAGLVDLPPGDCVVVEDVPAGVEAALSAGTRVVAVRTTYGADDLSRAHLVTGSVADLSPERLRTI